MNFILWTAIPKSQCGSSLGDVSRKEHSSRREFGITDLAISASYRTTQVSHGKQITIACHDYTRPRYNGRSMITPHTQRGPSQVKQLFRALILVSFLLVSPSRGEAEEQETFSLKVRVDGLRNSKGAVQFSLYNKKGTIPDEKFKRFYRQKVMLVVKNSSWTTFKNLPKGKYAVGIHHDENRNGKINKGFFLPTEGVGFTNYKSIGLRNRPKFSRASFDLTSNMKKSIKIIYF